MHNISWDLYRSFLGVLRAGSLLGAARELGLAQPTVGRHIDALEQALGHALFVRSPQGFAPTDQALRLQPYAEALSATAAALERAASGSDGEAKGAVRITASEVVGCELLPPILARLNEGHPAIDIELSLSNQTQDLLRREADIAVRMVRPTQQALVARHLGDIEFGLHAHPDYIARRGLPRKLDDLRAHSLIGFDHETAFIRSLKHHLGGLTRDDFSLRTDFDLAQLAAIRAGCGIGLCQCGIGRRHGLVHLLPRAVSITLPVWLAMHEDLRAVRRYAIVYAALADGLEECLSAPPHHR